MVWPGHSTNWNDHPVWIRGSTLLDPACGDGRRAGDAVRRRYSLFNQSAIPQLVL